MNASTQYNTYKMQQLEYDHLSPNAILEKKLINRFRTMLIEFGKDEKDMVNTAKIAKILSNALFLGEQYSQTLENATYIYNIGSIASRLTENKEEHHTSIGEKILNGRGLLAADMAANISAKYCEWWNGEGYPMALKEDEIDIASCIVAVAENICISYNATSHSEDLRFSSVLFDIISKSGTQFCPKVVDAFIANYKEIMFILEEK